MRRVLAAILPALLLAACADARQVNETADPGAGLPIAVTNVPVELRSADPKDLRAGSLIYRGGVSVVPGNDEEVFGGLSGFKVSADGTRFVSITDQGMWVTGSLTYTADGALAGMADVRIAPMLDSEGRPLEGKTQGDSEGLAFDDPHDLKGAAYVSYERDHRIVRYDFETDGVTARGVQLDAPPAFAELAENDGIEAIASLGAGSLLAIGERGAAGEDADSTGWRIDTTKPGWATFTVKRNLPYKLTDAVLLPDGRVLTLERRFAVTTGPGAELRVFDPAGFTEGAVVDGKVIATLFAGVTVDNMEGVAARKTADGKTLIYIVSDDNFQRPLQRTLLMMFELDE